MTSGGWADCPPAVGGGVVWSAVLAVAAVSWLEAEWVVAVRPASGLTWLAVQEDSVDLPLEAQVHRHDEVVGERKPSATETDETLASTGR